LQHDFASRVGHENVRPSVTKRRETIRRSLSVKPVMLGVAGFVAGVFMLALLLVGRPVDASVPTTKEEWLLAQAPKIVEGASMKKVQVEVGEAAATALGKLGFPYAEVMLMAKASKPVHSIAQVHAGQAFYRQEEGNVTHVYYDVDTGQRLHLYLEAGEQWQAELLARPLHTRQVRASGVVIDSLFSAALQAGVDEHTTMNLIDIFSWDVDFARDLREGDSFSVLYEEKFDDQGKMRGTDILAAEFTNQGETYQAIRFELADGSVEYFTPEGGSMRKTYLKSPVKFSRISSRFSSSRKHPVLGYTRAHRGIDYAAASGTPIRAIGDGTITYSAWKGGYGNVVEIRHTNSAHSTAYGHLRKFGRGIKRGKHVQQGQIIGYVGMTGLATGPHLHYEFRVRGRAVNPLTVKHEAANPVPASEMAKFQEVAANLTGRLSAPLIALVWE
jgi:murein DD-endopeptidase MepM/ murein hydrolase activator NlpD